MTILELTEYEIKDLISISQDKDGKSIPITFAKNDHELQKKLDKKILSIKSSTHNDNLLYTFRAKNYIGIVKFSKFTVCINPKIGIKKFIEMFNYVNKTDLKTPINSVSSQADPNILSEVVISIFLQQCQKLIRHGLLKSYNLNEDNAKFLKGKLIASQQILNQAKMTTQFACQYDEFEYDNIENQIILFCLKKIYGVTTNEQQKNMIRKLIQIFVNDVTDKVITLNNVKKIKYTQINYRYREIHALCKLIMTGIGMTNLHTKSNFTTSLFINMALLFEQFVLKIFQDFYDNSLYEVRGQKRIMSWVINKNKRSYTIIDIFIFEKEQKPLFFEKEQKTVHAIIDTKYKKEKISDSDRYQLVFYAHDHSKSKVYAILPKSLQTKNSPSIYHASEQKIEILVKYLDISAVLDMLDSNEPDSKKQIQKMLTELVPTTD